MTDYSGGCHCGRLKLMFSTSRQPREFVPRMDGCGFCQRHRGMAIADPAGHLVIDLPRTAPVPYRFGLNITDFHICDRCGVWIAATWRNGDHLLGVINVPALDDRQLFDREPVAADFEGEDVTARENRRRLNWMPTTIRMLE